MSIEFTDDKLRGRGRRYYQNLSRETNKATKKLTNAEKHRQLCRTSENNEVKIVKNTLQNLREFGPEWETVISNLAEQNIGPSRVKDNILEIAEFVHRKYHPIKEPVTTRTRKKILGFLPFGTEIEKTVYDDTEEEQKYIPPDGGITINITPFHQRILNSLLKHK